jgi:hypothetical protein
MILDKLESYMLDGWGLKSVSRDMSPLGKVNVFPENRFKTLELIHNSLASKAAKSPGYYKVSKQNLHCHMYTKWQCCCCKTLIIFANVIHVQV